MISLPTGTSIWIAAGVTDLRRGFTGLSESRKPSSSKTRTPAMCSSFEGNAATSSKCSGGMVTACVCFANASNAAASSGLRPKREQCRSAGHSFPCCWRALTGAGRYERQRLLWRYRAYTSRNVARALSSWDSHMDVVSKSKKPSLPDLNSLDIETLKALLVAKQSELDSRNTEIENLNLLILKLRRAHFGQRSEQFDRDIEQLELRLEDLEANQAAADPLPIQPAAVALNSKAPRKPARRPLPEALPRETETIAPKQDACPDCGCKLHLLGEDVTEMLEYIPARFKVIRTVRPKTSCSCCSRSLQAPAPSRPIHRGIAGPGLLAHVLVSKYSDHLPLYRQSEIYEREGLDPDRSTLADWVGGCARVLRPLVDALSRYVFSPGKLHADDVPVPVLEPGRGKTKTGRLWTYVRDDRPAGSDAAPAVWFAYSPDRKGEHPAKHLVKYEGILQADGYAGFNKLYETDRIVEAACWAHARRKFYDLFQAHRSPVAKEALERIAQLYGHGRRSADTYSASHHPGAGEFDNHIERKCRRSEFVHAMRRNVPCIFTATSSQLTQWVERLFAEVTDSCWRR